MTKDQNYTLTKLFHFMALQKGKVLDEEYAVFILSLCSELMQKQALEFEKIHAAFVQFAREGKYPISFADIEQYLGIGQKSGKSKEDQYQDNAMIWVDQIIGLIRKYGYTNFKTVAPLLNQAQLTWIKKQGGWPAVCQIREEHLPAMKAHGAKSFVAYQRQGYFNNKGSLLKELPVGANFDVSFDVPALPSDDNDQQITVY